MSEVVITVRGEQERAVAPERAVAQITVVADGPERGAVVERIAALAQPVRDDLAARKSAGGVVEWSSRRVAIWSQRPWNADGVQLAPVHHGSVELTATFDDVAALSWWIGEVAERDGVQVNGIDWQLTPATRRAVEAEVAASAVAVAVARATAYADALGLGTVTPLEIADTGLLQSAPSTPHSGFDGARMAALRSGGAELEFQPEDIVVTAAVDARFAAR